MRAAAVTDLPDEVVGRILALAGRPCGPHITQTCRQWRRLFYQQPAVWRCLCLHMPVRGIGSNSSSSSSSSIQDPDEWLRGQLVLLRRVGALVQDAFLYTGRRDDVLSQLLRGLAGTALTRLELVCRQLPAGNGSALAQLTGLRCLQLGVGSPLPQSLPALPPALRELAVDSPTLPSLSQLGILASAQPAAQLTSLTLRSNSSTLPPLQPLTALTRLRELECVELHGGDGGLPLLPTSAFPSLSRMAFVAARGLLASGGRLVQSVPGRLAATVQLRRDPACASAWLLGCADLQLSQTSGPLDALLAALGVAPAHLSRVFLQRCDVAPCGLPAVLPGVTRLMLEGSCSGGPALVPRLPRLQVANLLQLEPEAAEDTLQALASLTTLHTLQCDGGGMRDLPAGRYLAGLTALHMCGARFDCLPRALAGAARLETLALEDCPLLHLTAADVGAVLARMPALRVLRLTEGCTDVTAAAAAHMRTALPRLDVQLRPSPAAAAPQKLGLQLP